MYIGTKQDGSAVRSLFLHLNLHLKERTMMMDVNQAAKAMRDEEMNDEIEDFIEGFNQPTPTAACGSTASGSLPGHPEMVGQAIRGPDAEWMH